MPRISLALVLFAVATGCSQPAPAPDTPGARPLPETPSTPDVAGPVFAGPLRADAAVDAATLVAAMHGRHSSTWYRTLSFTQRTSRRQPDGTVAVETWREWAALPGRLRIEMGDPMAGLDALFLADSTYLFRDGALAAARAERNGLLLWGFDVYVQDPAETLRIAAAEGLDLDAFRTDIWDGRAVFVLGTPEAGEVWVEQDRLLFVRLVEGPQDARFENYQRLGGGWIAPYVAVRVDGDLVFWETYSDMVSNPPLDPVLFDPARWAEGISASD